jgi:uncharacterized protein (DUF1499 family)
LDYRWQWATRTKHGAFVMPDTQRPHQTAVEVQNFRRKSQAALSTLASLLSACAATAPAPDVPGAPGAQHSGHADLACSLPSNCVSSLGNGGLVPLPSAGTPAHTLAVLQATLASFPEATVVRSDPLAIEVIFTTPVGFRDQVNFKIDPEAQRVDFRSRSLFGLFDWGKNRSRMLEFKTRFEQQARLLARKSQSQ